MDISEGHELQQSTWQHSAVIMVGMVLGTGIMGLPHAMAKLGWVVGIIALISFCFFTIYSGLLLSRVRNEYYPQAESYADLALELVGPRFATFTRWLTTAQWFFTLPYYLMV